MPTIVVPKFSLPLPARQATMDSIGEISLWALCAAGCRRPRYRDY